MKALVKLDRNTALCNAHLMRSYAWDTHFLRFDELCTDEFISAALHPTISQRPADDSDRVHILRPAVSLTIVHSVEMHISSTKDARTLAKRLQILDKRRDQDDGSDTICTYLDPQANIDAILVPLNSPSQAHWTLLVFYRLSPQRCTWRARHYDTLGTLNHQDACEFMIQFSHCCKKLRSDFVLENEQTCKLYLCKELPQQRDSFSCGYRVILLALIVCYAHGNAQIVHQMLQQHYLTERTCAQYVAHVIASVCQYQHLFSVQQRCENIIDFSK